MLSFTYSEQAAAALIIAHAATGAAFNMNDLLTLVPHLDLGRVQVACSKLTELHRCACVAAHGPEGSAPWIVPVRDKYLTAEWCQVAALAPVAPQKVLQLL